MLGSVRHLELVNCHSSAAPRRHLYYVQQEKGEVEAAIIDHIVSEQLEATAQHIGGEGSKRTRTVLTHALSTRGACVCFKCPVPIIVHRRNALHRASLQSDAAPPQASTAPQEAALGRGQHELECKQSFSPSSRGKRERCTKPT